MKKAPTQMRKCLFSLARLEGLEPTTYGLEVRCSIQLSYRGIWYTLGKFIWRPSHLHYLDSSSHNKGANRGKREH